MKEVVYEKILNLYLTEICQEFNKYQPKKPVKKIDLDDTFIEEKYYLYPKNHFTVLSTLRTEEDFVKNYVNPLARVTHYRVTIKVEKNDQKVGIKIFEYKRFRNAGCKFYKKTTRVEYLGFNTKDCSVYNGFISNYHKKRKFTKRMNKNCFWRLPCNNILNYLRNVTTIFYSEINKTNTPIENLNTITSNVFNSFFNQLNIDVGRNPDLSYDDEIYKLYLDKNKIKYSNNWKIFRTLYPSVTKKDLKKFDFKYIDTFMNIWGLKGDKIKRVLHKVDSFSSMGLEMAYKSFGENYVLSHNDDIIKKIIESEYVINTYSHFDFTKVSTKEKSNAFEIYKLLINGEIAFGTFIDHISFYKKLRFIENIKWKSNTYESFLDEHWLWTEKTDYNNQGSFTRIYSDNFKNSVEVPIVIDDLMVYPILLTNNKEYNFESFTQSNCVKTYLRRENSVIISLRKLDKESKERATIEYRIIHDGEKVIKLKRVQSLGRFNYKLDESWEIFLNELDSRVNSLVNNGHFNLPDAILEVGNTKIHTNLMVDVRLDLQHEADDSYGVSLKWKDEELVHMIGNENSNNFINIIPYEFEMDLLNGINF